MWVVKRAEEMKKGERISKKGGKEEEIVMWFGRNDKEQREGVKEKSEEEVIVKV